MKKAPVLKNENKRIKELQDLNILETSEDVELDNITALAAQICNCEISLISLVDSKRQWFKSKYGINVDETPRDIAYCAHAIEQNDVFEIEDSTKDKRFFDNPLSTNSPFVRFYAGAPLFSSKGLKLGTLCVIDKKAKKLNNEQKENLKLLSKIAMSIIEKNYGKNGELHSVGKKFEDIQSMTKAGGWELDLSTNKTYWSSGVYKIYGLPEGEAPDKFDSISFYHQSERERLKEFIYKCQTEGIPFQGEFKFIDYTGKSKWVFVNGKPLSNNKNEIVRLIGSIQDITKSKDFQESLILKNLEVEAYLRSLNKHAIVAKTDVNGNITFANCMFEKISGYSKSELLGKNHSILNSGYHSKDFFKDIWSFIKSGKEWRGEIKNKAKNGTYYWVDTTIAPEFDKENKLNGFISIRFDITDRKIAELELQKRENRLQQLFEQSNDALMTLEPPYWNFSSGNTAALKLFKIPSLSRFKELSPADISPKLQADGSESSTKAKEVISEAIENGSCSFEWIHKTSTGKEIPCSVLLSRIDEGSSHFLHATVRDITHEKKLKDKLIETNTSLDMALKGGGLGVWDWDLTTDHVNFDVRWAEMLGLDHNQIKMSLKTWEEVVHPEDLKKCYEDINNYLQGKTDHFENIHRTKHKDGHWVYILGKGRISQRDNNGRPIRLTGTNLDITETQNAHEEKMKEFSDILSSTPTCLAIINKDNEIVYMNEKGKDLLDIDNSNTETQISFLNFIHSNYKDEFYKLNQKTCSGHKQYLVFQIVTTSGVSKWLEIFSAPYKLINGEAANISMVNDITQRILDEEELEKQKQISFHTAKLASIGELAAGVGHEINNPLTVATNYLKQINKLASKDNIDIEKFTKSSEKIKKSLDRVANIVKGLKTFSRDEKEEFDNFNFSELMNESIDLVKNIYQKDLVYFKSEITPDVCIYGNRGRLQQVIINLLSNAKDALNGKNGEIAVSLYTENDSAVVLVEDTGQGIPEDIKRKIFDPFFTTKPIGEGTGIGLAISNQIINQHSGEIKVVKSDSKGTIFKIVLSTESQDSPHSNPKTIQEINVNKNPSESKALTILLAEDEPDIRELLQEMLTSLGHKVLLAKNGEEALEQYQKYKEGIDVILTDMKMPKKDGLEFLKEVSVLGKRPRSYIISGGVNIDFEDDSLEINNLFDGHLAKPFDEESIVKLLEGNNMKAA